MALFADAAGEGRTRGRSEAVTPLTVVPITPPIEATLRILLNSVPYLIGAAVVRQPAGADAVAAEVGRMPWLHDRRLTTLELPDDTLPPNKAVPLDWPLPYQAEWVGAPPRLLISRLVAQGRTVGVLFGTIVGREPLSPQAREALDLSCELIASAVASESFTPPVVSPSPSTPLEPERAPIQLPDLGAVPPETQVDRQVIDDVRRALATVSDARSLGRVLRAAMNAITEASAFSVALFGVTKPEVAYRYKVVGADPQSSQLGRQPVDDGPASYAARLGRRWHTFAREVALRGVGLAERRQVTVLQVPIASGADVFGMVTLQTFRGEGFADRELRLIADVVDASAEPFAEARRVGRFLPEAEAPFSLDRLPSPVIPSPPEPAAAAVLPSAAAAPPSARSAQPSPRAEVVLGALLARCADIGLATTIIVGVDPSAGVLRGELASASAAARELDYALGIASGKFVISLDDRHNAIARACREARIVSAVTVHELVQPLFDWQDALVLERLANGGRSTVLPLIVSGDVVGALVIGPMAEEASVTTIDRARGFVEETANALAELWRSDVGGPTT